MPGSTFVRPMLPFRMARQLWRLSVFGLTLVLALSVWVLWYGMNSDRDNIPPFLTQVIPGGNCVCQTSTTFLCSSCLSGQTPALAHSPSSTWHFQYGRDDRNPGLAQDQCDSAFRGLYEDLIRSADYWGPGGKITRAQLDRINLMPGMTRAMLHDGHLYVVASRSKGEDHRRKALAILSSISRALDALPDRTIIPNIEFVFSVEDKASDVQGTGHPLWVFARKASEQSLWLMPDFGFWAWDNIIDHLGNLDQIGPYDEVVQKATNMEKTLAFAAKEPKLVWRGKLSFAPKLRRTLLHESKNHNWSAVGEIDWHAPRTYLSMEDHCKYQFIAHAEGRSYSASLKYRQACRSVIVIHKLQYIQHYHYLLVSDGPWQNYVEVERDFSDLPDKMSDLLSNGTKAESIADNAVQTFRERYLTQAAEACYWRALWRRYAEVSQPAKLWESDRHGADVKRGLRYETFLLLPGDEMLKFAVG